MLALSGLHLSIIWALLGVFCIGRWRTPFTMLMISTIWAYVLFAAMPPSAVRAAIMLTLMSVATLTGRQGASLNTLAFAAIIILLFSPSSIYDLGFQLSFTAVAFIVVFTNPVMNFLPLQWRIAHPWAT
ncbi:ComEC/Rec2 family competence protein, partial [Parabacteroides distasonis]